MADLLGGKWLVLATLTCGPDLFVSTSLVLDGSGWLVKVSYQTAAEIGLHDEKSMLLPLSLTGGQCLHAGVDGVGRCKGDAVEHTQLSL